jgi:hypothetical protein
MLDDEGELPTTDMKFTDEQYEEMEIMERLRWLIWSMRAEID